MTRAEDIEVYDNCNWYHETYGRVGNLDIEDNI